MTDKSWRDGNVAERNLHMLNSESMADCTFVVGFSKTKKFQCHKNILSHGSSVFDAMFNGGLQEKGAVKVEDIEPQHFRKMLEFIYSDNTELENVESALNVCYAATKYMINTLKLKCIEFAKKNLNNDNVCKALEFARLIDNADLEAASLQYLQTHIRGVFRSVSFCKAAKATLLTILRQDDLYIESEVEVIAACIFWAKTNKRDAEVTLRLRDVLGLEVLSLIRFLTITAQEFAAIVVPNNLLKAKEACHILCRLVTGTGNMPLGFSINTKTRAVFGPRETIQIETSCELCAGSGGEMSNFPFNFIVNAEIFISGLQLYGFNNYIFEVQDSFVVCLFLNSKLQSSVKFEGLISDRPVEVDFKKPILLKANTTYALQIRYRNPNWIYNARGKNRQHSVYTTTAGVEMTVDYRFTTVSKIYIAKQISK